MEIRVIEYFLAVAREGTISDAAKYLHITQPTLSRQLKELEGELGKELFERGNRQITLTEEGLIFQKRAEEIMSLVNKTTNEIMNTDNNLSGDIYIGAGESSNMSLITKAIKKVQDEYPNIIFHLYSGNYNSISSRLDNGLLDLAILFGEGDFSKYEFMKLPTKDTFGFLVNKKDPLSSKKYITVEDLKDQSLIMSEQTNTNNELQDWLGSKSNKLNVKMTYNLPYNAYLLVQQGGYCAQTIDNLHEQFSKDVIFIPLKPRITLSHRIVWKKYQRFSKATKYFLQVIEEEIKNYQK